MKCSRVTICLKAINYYSSSPEGWGEELGSTRRLRPKGVPLSYLQNANEQLWPFLEAYMKRVQTVVLV